MNIKITFSASIAALGLTYLAVCVGKIQMPADLSNSTMHNYTVSEASNGQAVGPDAERRSQQLREHDNFVLSLVKQGYHAMNVENNRPKAERIFRQALKEFDGCDDAYISLARLLEKQGREQEALTYYREFLGPHPNWRSSLQDDVGINIRYAELCDKYGQEEEALAAYRKVLWLAAHNQAPRRLSDTNMVLNVDAQEPNQVRARAYLIAGMSHQTHSEGYVYPKPEMATNMLHNYEKAVRLEPNLPIAHYFLAQGLKQAGRKTEAQQELARAERLGDETFRTALHKRERDKAEADRLYWKDNDKHFVLISHPMTANQVAREMAIQRTRQLKYWQSQGKLLNEKPPVIPPEEK